VVKFHDYVELPYEDRVEEHIQKLRIGPWDQLVKEFPGITFRRLYTAHKPEKIRALVDSATERDRTYSPPNLLTYFVIDCPPGVAPEALVKVLLAWQAVQTAYFDPPGDEPQVNPANNPRWLNQVYLDPAPNGINAEFAWPQAGGLGFPGGDGAGLTVIDLERGWTLNHEDLNAHGITLLHGSIRNGSRAHGTSVLGEICAVDNNLGCIGIAPNVASANVVSYWNSTRSNAILAAIANLSFGDLLLLEAQLDITGWQMMPIEVLDAEFNTIRLATALGIVVVEAAGNGGNDLDTYTDSSGNAIFDRTAAGFRDSGAIVVGAASSTVPHVRIAPPTWTWGSNFGSRIDCYAWGENVDTCRSNNNGSTTMYTGTFGGTSSASPIITGAALIVQGIAENPASGIGYRFSPQQIRAILSDAATGTASNNPAVDRIGVMPNLQAIIQNVLNVAPDVYIRDFVGDTGDPHTGAISASPDIILVPSPVANPQASFGQGSGTENSNTLGYEAKSGQDNFIYVRTLNRGGVAATNVDVTVFWAPPSTLLTPDLWTRIPLAPAAGPSVTVPNLPAGNVLTVSNAITWPAAEIPAQGHYCFVGLIGNAEDPAPDPADFLDWNNYRRFIRENNNVTWRNFNVVSNTSSPGAGDPAGYVVLPFLAPGAPDRARLMQLEVMARLPRGARAFLEVPTYLVDAMQEHSPFVKMDKKSRAARLPVNPHGRRTFREVMFPAKSRAKLRLLVHIPEKLRKNEYEVFVRQLYKDEEVGRVTWRLVPPSRKVRPYKQRKTKR
jgi:hypothetical protein